MTWHHLVEVFLGWYAHHEILGLFLFLTVEEAGIPLLIPGDTLVIVAGARDRNLWNAVLVCGVAAAATAVGSSLLYAVVRARGHSFLLRFGKYLHLNPSRIATLERWFHRHGAAAIVVGRVVPGMRTPTTIMAALFGVPYRTFAPATATAGIIWALIYFYLGVVLQRAWLRVAGMVMENLRIAILVALLAVVIGVAGGVLLRNNLRDGSESSA